MKLKTLNDIGNKASDKEGLIQCCRDCQIDYFWSETKSEAIRWINEDIDKSANETTIEQEDAQIKVIDRWMKRLNITSEDLE